MSRCEGDEFVDQVRSFINGLDGVHWPTIALAAAVLVVLLVLGPVGAAAARSADRDARWRRLSSSVFLAGPQRDSRSSATIPSGLPTPRIATDIRSPTWWHPVDPGRRHRDRRVLRQRVDGPHVSRPAMASEWTPTPSCARWASATSGTGLLHGLPGELQRQPHRARRRTRQPHPALFGGHAGVRASW